ncbi:hypothetical protein BN59_02438 [Legionella massiliensis]|uniref:Dot/Icm T4SS effector n=1 Tax=Legionella massiliensis TaxID=1034943 RepID=A0A078KYW7_9GAMM|nr:hypothetical protein [Legionella massiliensis]CDZ78131.1 hypothetical protein BN59_02438 [Legionella massiliensis]CEE13869.1 hypothetical protein BN1094_02438 [Legionella massiliensis]
MARILGISFDFDGSLSPAQPENIIADNIDLLINIKRKMADFDLTRIFVGSNRQSDIDDNMNGVSNRTGSCYPKISQISDFIGAAFDDSLMADFYNDLLPGESMRRALTMLNPYSEDKERFDYDFEQLGQAPTIDWLHDRSKLSILITQIQKLASEHPNDEIEFEFYDDNPEIIAALRNYFSISENCQLLPKNLKAFRLGVYPPLYRKDGADLVPDFSAPIVGIGESPIMGTDENPIVGTGEIDFNYRQTLKRMAAACIESPGYQAYEPVAKRTRVTNYSHVEYAGFTLTAPMDFIRDYKPGMVPKVEPHPVPPELKRYSDIVNLAAEPSSSQNTSSSSSSSSSSIPQASTSSRFLNALSAFIPSSQSFKFRRRAAEEKKKLHSRDTSESTTSTTNLPIRSLTSPKLGRTDSFIIESNSPRDTNNAPPMQTSRLIDREGIDSKTEDHHSASSSSYDTEKKLNVTEQSSDDSETDETYSSDSSTSDTASGQSNFFQPATKQQRDRPITLSPYRGKSFTQ